MDKLKLYKIYELVMVLLALIVVMILTLEFTMEITEATSRLFSSILGDAHHKVQAW